MGIKAHGPQAGAKRATRAGRPSAQATEGRAPEGGLLIGKNLDVIHPK